MGFAIAQYVTPEYLERRSKQDGECRVWTGVRNPRGYGHFTRAVNGKLQTIRAHRAAYAVYKGEEPGELEVMHHCDNPSCINPAHLAVGTHNDNMADMKAKGRAIGLVGAANKNAKLCAEAINEIRSSPKRYGLNRRLAEKHGVTATQIWRIRSGRNWNEGERP